MDDLVLDASAAGKTIRNEPHSTALRSLLEDAVQSGARFLVPPVFPFEIRNLLARTAQETGKTELLWEHYKNVMDLFEKVPVDDEKDYHLAITQRITVHDAQYIQAAIDHRAVLVTYDIRQEKAATSAGVKTLRPR